MLFELALTLALSSSKVAAIDSMAERLLISTQAPSLSVAVVENGKIVFTRGYGSASLAPSRRADENTRYVIGSISKQFTAAAVMQLVEANRVSLDDAVATWFPDLTDAGTVTVRELLTHTSGYHDYFPLDYVRHELLVPRTPAEIVETYARMPLDFPSGTRWSYSNTGYMLLAQIVERVSGRPYCSYVQEHFFGPLGMRQSTCDPRHRGSNLAVNYARHFLGPWRPELLPVYSWGEGAGSIVSTPSDIAKWDIALMNGNVVNRESFSAMTTSTKVGSRDTHYGFGLFVRNRGGVPYYRHGGGVAGFVSDNAIVPSTGDAFVAFSNGQSLVAGGFIDGAMDVLLGQDSASPAKSASPAPAPTEPPESESFKSAVVTAVESLAASPSRMSPFSTAFAEYLAPDILADAHSLFAPLKAPPAVTIEATSSRGERAAFFDARFAGGTVHSGVIYLTPDGKIDEFAIYT